MRAGLVGIVLLSLVSGGCAAKKPIVTDYASKADIVELQGEMIVQMEALLEEVRQDSRNTRASVKKVVSDCLCPSEMK